MKKISPFIQAVWPVIVNIHTNIYASEQFYHIDFNIFDEVKLKLLKLFFFRRVVVPPGTGGLARRAVTGGIKKRLGVLGNRDNCYGTLINQC